MTSKFAYKTRGSDAYQSHVTQGLSQPTNSCGEPTFLLPVGNFGLLTMKESLRTTLDPNTVFYTRRCRQLQNTTSLLAPLVNLQAASLILLDGIPPPPISIPQTEHRQKCFRKPWASGGRRGVARPQGPMDNRLLTSWGLCNK